MKKPVWIVVVIVVLVLIVWGISSLNKNDSSGTADDAIKIGIIAPLTGTAASYGVEGKNTVVLALDQMNASGGIAGKKIEYFVEDGKCDAKTALDAWNKLVNINHVSVVFGGHCSTETMAIAPLSAKDQVPVFAVFSTVTSLPNEGEWLFRHISTNAYYGTILAGQAYKKGYRNVAVLTEVKDFPVTYSDAFIKAFKELGGTVTLDERFAPDSKDYRTVALKLKTVKYDAVFVSAQGADVMALVTNQIKELGLEKAYMYNHAFSTSKFLEVTKGVMPKEYIITIPYADPNTEKIAAFNKAYTEKYGKLYTFTPFFLAADYDVVHRFKDAAEACAGSATGYSIDCVRDQFKNAKSYSGVAGDVTVSSLYSPKSILTSVGLLKINNGVQTVEPTM